MEHGAQAAEGAHPFDPLAVFGVRPLFGQGDVHWYTITNATLWMAIAVLAIFALLVLGTARRAVVPTRAQSVAEFVHNFVYKMVEDVAGHDGMRHLLDDLVEKGQRRLRRSAWERLTTW